VAASLAYAPFSPASDAALPKLVDRPQDLPSANSKLEAAGIAGGLIGPAAAAGLLLVADASLVFVVNAATFVFSAALILSIKGDFRPVPRTKETGSLSAGFRFLSNHRILRPVTLGYGIVFLGLGVTGPAEVALSDAFDAGDTGFAAMTAIFSIGGLIGTRMGSYLTERNPPMAVLTSASAALAVGLCVVAFAPIFGLVLSGMAVGGAAYSMWRVAHNCLLQSEPPDDLRSRVIAASQAVEMAAMSAGFLLAGVAIALIGPAGAFGIGSIGALAILIVFLTRRIRPATIPFRISISKLPGRRLVRRVRGAAVTGSRSLDPSTAAVSPSTPPSPTGLVPEPRFARPADRGTR
jgi:MFS family permease